ncbi:sugar O-acyltransferase (sialic acid O-acetyltransferase NeuD family) [Paraburkholderia unamae]|uniref:NeuD/PglB/VioB family sugar acetyltransferase n=1 Tax=Paraburkholderia unamae TaxID=219649 RepID=UPI000DC264E7|nr:NeuD/PglB/VioB family sugar acetyltransferase [Paraburkholderia unamae]RAR66717.1 sugar O-acyltransferase (sialic acid O-acetyltransferase NeuD family) [Paraburkholderia unamae]
MSNAHRNLLIVGAGGFGREVLAYVEDDNPLFKVKGFLDGRPHALDATPRDVPIVGDPLTYQPLPNEAFMAALGDPQQRFKYTATLRDVHDVDFATVVHPRANVSKHAHLAHGCIIGPGVGISVDTHVGAFTCIQEYTVVGHDARIGEWSQINSHCTIAGGARIGNFVTIHPNCVITSRAVIGDGATVAPGSVVIGRIPAGITVLGNPAKRFSFR